MTRQTTQGNYKHRHRGHKELWCVRTNDVDILGRILVHLVNESEIRKNSFCKSIRSRKRKDVFKILLD